MGLELNVAVVLREWLLKHEASGPVATLGVQDVGFSRKTFSTAIGTPWPTEDRAMDAREYFAMSGGLNDVSSIDVSTYEGADFEFDLNAENLPPEMVGRFGVVLNGGTLEHVFHVPNALTSITRMLKPGGLAVHILPMSNCVDHGFYQFGPTLMLDYYSAANFDLLSSASIHFGSHDEPIQVKPALPGSYGEGLIGAMDAKAAFHLFAARKRPDSLDKAIPIQSLYGRQFTGVACKADAVEWFSAYEMKDGLRVGSRQPVEMEISSFSAGDGSMWSVALPESFGPGDSSESPIISGAALFEDGKLLGPAHSMHQTIRTIGRGAYSHWGNALYFSTSDGSDPNTNGRRYACKC